MTTIYKGRKKSPTNLLQLHPSKSILLGNSRNMWLTFLIIPFLLVKANANDCVPRSFGTDRIVCVCNATYCDGLPEDHPEVPKDGSAYLYETNKEGLRLKVSTIKFDTCLDGERHILNLDRSKKYQKVLGFGGAITDSVGINIKKLSPAAQEQLLRSYYDPKTGSKYNMGRVPIGGSDFSTRPYTYDDVENDETLEHFALAPEDYNYKIPFMKRAVELNPEMRFVSAVWSPPKWMKTNNKLVGYHGFLKKSYYQVYANYIMKFLDEYKKNGLDLWAVSTGNEPINAFIPMDPLSDMGWTPSAVATWVADNLGPTLNQSQHDTLILAIDDQRIFLPWFFELIARNEKAKDYIAGIASHWYMDNVIANTVLDETHQIFPEKFLLMTEASSVPKVDLGSWDRGEAYITSIIDYMNHWYGGWIDWNIALDEDGGPTYISNFVDAPIIVNGTSDEFYKQPMYYALKHFSRFVDRDSVRISISDANSIMSVAFETPSNEIVVVLYNSDLSPRKVTLKDAKRGDLYLELSPYSMNTIKYK